MNAYLADILDQPQALRQALQKLELEDLDPFRGALQAGRIDRILLTGMGASLYAMYPAWLRLAQAGLPAIWVDAAELVHHAQGLVGERTLLWVASQSGRSAEVLRLLELVDARKTAGLLALTNELESPLGQFALAPAATGFRGLLPIHAAREENPSTRTYLNSLAISQLAALSLDPSSSLQSPAAPAWAGLAATADLIEAYLVGWESIFEAFEKVFSSRQKALSEVQPQIVLVGRGPSLTTALCGALCLQEAAKIPALGLQAGEFRHGPLEMANSDLTVLIFEGDPASETARLNRKLWQNLRDLGANSWLLSGAETTDPVVNLLRIPAASGLGLPLAEIVPVQLLCYYLSEKSGLVPGAFKHIGKVTQEE